MRSLMEIVDDLVGGIVTCHHVEPDRVTGSVEDFRSWEFHNGDFFHRRALQCFAAADWLTERGFASRSGKLDGHRDHVGPFTVFSSEKAAYDYMEMSRDAFEWLK